jgi:hypothetical protein
MTRKQLQQILLGKCLLATDAVESTPAYLQGVSKKSTDFAFFKYLNFHCISIKFIVLFSGALSM